MNKIIKWFGNWKYPRLTGYTVVIVFWTIIILLMSSCGSMAQLSDAEYMRRANVQKQIDFVQAEYNYTLDSLYTEYYKQK